MNIQHLQLIALLSHELQEVKNFNLENLQLTLMYLSEECQSGKDFFFKRVLEIELVFLEISIKAF